MFEAMVSSPFFGLGLTLICWRLAVFIQKKTRLLICNPVLVASALAMAALVIFRIPLEQYNIGGNIVKMLLAPATAALALNIYHQRAILKQYFWPVVLGCLAGSLASILCVLLLCRLFQSETALLNSLLPKSVTTAIAVSIAESAGGLPGLTAVSVVITGVEGVVLAPALAKVFHVEDPVAEGVAIGACSHALGTSKAMEIGPLQGAMSSIALCVCGIMTSVLAVFFAA